MQTILKETASQLINLVLPPRCVISGEVVDKQGMISASAWRELSFINEPFCNSCGFPFEFEVEDGALCASCLDYPPHFENARAALKYDDGSRALILGFKHADKTYAVKSFMPWMNRAAQNLFQHTDILMPVPLHYTRLISRRYNQAALISSALAKETGIPTINDGLKRTRATVSQGHMDAKGRYKNVKKAFAVNKRYKNSLKGKTVMLIDDVYTTGATVNECAKTLKKAGVNEVYVLTLARAVKEGFG